MNMCKYGGQGCRGRTGCSHTHPLSCTVLREMSTRSGASGFDQSVILVKTSSVAPKKCLLATMVRKSPPTMRAKKPAGVGPEAASRFFEKYGSMHTEFGPQKKSGAVVIVRPNAEK